MADELSGDTWGQRFVLRAAARIRDTRRAQGHSVRELAERTKELGHEVTRQVLVNLEAGRRGSLSIDDLFVIAHALGVNPLFLLFDHGQMGRPNEVLPELLVPEWMALQWARSAPSEISSTLYEGDFDDARSTIAQREQLDRLDAEVFFLEHQLERLLAEGKSESAEATRATIAAHRDHQQSIRSLLERNGTQMNDAWYQERSIRDYRTKVFGEDSRDDG